jgi:hypothetical protein
MSAFALFAYDGADMQVHCSQPRTSEGNSSILTDGCEKPVPEAKE